MRLSLIVLVVVLGVTIVAAIAGYLINKSAERHEGQ